MDAAIFLFNIIIKYITPSSIIKCSFTDLYFYMQNKKTIPMKELEVTKKPSLKHILQQIFNLLKRILERQSYNEEEIFALRNKIDNPIIQLKSYVIPEQIQKNIPKAYTYIGNNTKDRIMDLKSLHENLIDGKFISKSTKGTDIKRIFSCKLPATKIIWIETKGSLHYFIRQLHEKSVILDLKHDIWNVTSNLFIIYKHDNYNFSDLRNHPKPRKISIKNIDNAVGCLTPIVPE